MHTSVEKGPPVGVLTEWVQPQNLRWAPWRVPGFGIALAILILNLLDALFTLAFLQLGLAEEANPLMSLVYRSSPLGFVLVKLAMVQLGVMILQMNHRVRLAQYALNAGVTIYVCIVAYHLAFIANLALR